MNTNVDNLNFININNDIVICILEVKMNISVSNWLLDNYKIINLIWIYMVKFENYINKVFEFLK